MISETPADKAGTTKCVVIDSMSGNRQVVSDLTNGIRNGDAASLCAGTALAASIDYTYTAQGKLLTPTWARSVGGNRVTTTYDYFGDGTGELKTGEMQAVTYSDGTQGVQVGNETAPFDAYDRLGRPKKITDAAGTRTFGYNAGMQLETEAINPTGGGLYSKLITRKYQTTGDAKGRSLGFFFGEDEETSEYKVSYYYDDQGRFERVTGPGLPAYGVEYERQADNDAVAYVRYKADAETTLAQTRRRRPRI